MYKYMGFEIDYKKTMVLIIRDFPFTLHRNSPALLKSHNIKISLRLQKFSSRPSELSRNLSPENQGVF